jgi:hypothetical protein
MGPRTLTSLTQDDSNLSLAAHEVAAQVEVRPKVSSPRWDRAR